MTPLAPLPPVALRALPGALPAGGRFVGDPTDVTLRDVTHDSREAGPGILFAARPGATADGHDFVSAAAAAGSPAALVERPVHAAIPQLVVPSVARALGPAAAEVAHRPSDALALLGVTGTNGKTTTTYLLEAGLSAAGHVPGVIGTIETRMAGTAVPGVRTTPEATDLQRLLRRMVDAGATAAAVEVSSHGLALHRVDGTRFAAVGFTNLSQDHLDFHADLGEYEAAKARLLTATFSDVAVVVVDGEVGARLADSSDVARVVRVSATGVPGADVRARDVVTRPGGSSFTALLPDRAVAVSLRLTGAFNVTNALLALAMLDAAGVDVDLAVHGLGALDGVPGRMERVDEGQPFTVLVDYAHTPDSVASALRAARGLTEGRVLVVVGAGGDRDPRKRPLMGEAAARGADLAVLTTDNPRSEDPAKILDAVAAGAARVTGQGWTTVLDRREAIAHALSQARPGDVVVVAGKGHETYQEVAGVRHDHDDRLVAAELLRRAG